MFNCWADLQFKKTPVVNENESKTNNMILKFCTKFGKTDEKIIKNTKGE